VQIAIVGLAGSGKTTVFNTLTRGHAETGGYGGVTLNVGVVKVPDDRLDRLAEIFKPKKVVHADVTYVDLPAPPASTEGHVGTEELPAEHLARLRESDALLHVVRAFEDPSLPHAAGSVDPARDLEQLDLEFILADLSMVDRRLERLAASGRHGTPAEREANERLRQMLPACQPQATGASLVTRAGDPVREIVSYAAETNADLVVLGTHGRGPVAHMLMGSVAERVVRTAPCPVLTVRHPQHEFVSDVQTPRRSAIRSTTRSLTRTR